jgi:tRNA(adenine34) deaminase
MDKAIEYAKISAQNNPLDVPVGCVIVKDNKIISYGFNTREKQSRITGHAEIQAIEEAEKILGDHRLQDCKIFVTLEPCPMCAGAIRAAQIEELYFGAYNLSDGAAGTVYNLLYPYVKVFGGIKKSDCESLIKDFFTHIRNKP